MTLPPQQQRDEEQYVSSAKQGHATESDSNCSSAAVETASVPIHPNSERQALQSVELVIPSMAASPELHNNDGVVNPDPTAQHTKRCFYRVGDRPLFNGNREAKGWALDAIGRSVSFISAAVFLGTALLNLAKQEAGCETDPPSGETTVPECHGRVHGIRPSSLLTTYTLIVGLASSALLPFMGAIIDYTSIRRGVGRVSAALYCVILFAQIFLSEQTWFAVAILQVIVAFVGWVHSCIAFAYLPELTTHPDTLLRWTAIFTIVQFLSMVLFILVMVVIFAVADLTDDEVASARIAQGASFLITAPVFAYSWGKLFRERPALQKIPENSSLFTAGFKNVFRTAIRIYKHHAALRWFFFAIAFSESAAQALGTIAITYMTDQLEFTSTENGIAILCMLVASIPGSLISTFLTRRFKPVRSGQLSMVVLMAVTAVAAAVLTGPGQQIPMYLLAAGWGIGTGWKYTTERFITCTIIPKGQDTELMGMYLFAGQVLTWLPPLVFTAMNEAGVSMRVSFASIDIFFSVAVILLCFMGDYDEAVRQANTTGVEEHLEGAEREEIRTETNVDEKTAETDFGCENGS